MGKYVAESAIKRLIAAGSPVNGSRIGILGLTFKENVPDLRNTRVIDLIQELRKYGAEVIVNDAEADAAEALAIYGVKLEPLSELHDLDALVLAVGHEAYGALAPRQLRSLFRDPAHGIVLDVKGFFDPEAVRAQGLDYWRL